MPDLWLAFTLYKNVIFWDVEISTFLPGIFLTFFAIQLILFRNPPDTRNTPSTEAFFVQMLFFA